MPTLSETNGLQHRSAGHAHQRRLVSLFGCRIDCLRMSEAVDRIFELALTPAEVCAYMVTPNLDHSVMLRSHKGLKRAYADAALVTVDGMPLVWASRLLGRPLPERLSGTDVVIATFDAADARGGLRVFLLGAGPGVADQAAGEIMRKWRGVNVVGTYSPPFGFENDAQENAVILARIAAASPDLLLVGLGAPKQELWVHANRHEIRAPTAMCIGAAIDFLAGHKSRAPGWMRKNGLEWLHRLATEPRRLFRRYAHDALRFPQLLWEEWNLDRRGEAVAAENES